MSLNNTHTKQKMILYPHVFVRNGVLCAYENSSTCKSTPIPTRALIDAYTCKTIYYTTMYWVALYASYI